MTPEEERILTEELKKQAALRQEINSSLDSYLKAVQKANRVQKTIVDNEKIQKKIEDDLLTATGDKKIELEASLKILKKQTLQLKAQGKIIKDTIAEAKKGNLIMSGLGVAAAKGLSNLPNLLKRGFGDIKSMGLFEMDKAIKKSAMEMGVLGTRSDIYRKNIKLASDKTNELGMGIKELALMQAQYSEGLGRTVMLGQDGLNAMAEMASSTVLGAEGAAKMAAEMDAQGYSAKRTSGFVEDTMNDASKMGLNASKVIKNIQNNIKMLNKYNFKGGVQGLAKMAATVARLGVDMNVAAGMAEKLFDIEGAVDMSAQLQVMGGKWAQLADPFKLMFMARNDMEGLTKALGEAAESSVSFNNKTKEFEISALEMHRLRKVAEQTGVAYEDLAEMGKRAAKSTSLKKQMSWNVDPEMQDFLAATAQWDKNGKGTILDINGNPKLLSALTESDKTMIKNQMLEKKSLAERAVAAQSFDEKLTNLMNMLKSNMLPIVEGLDKVLGPFVKDLFANKEFIGELKAFGKSIGEFVIGGSKLIKMFAEAAVWLGPTGTLAAFLGVKSAMWIANGVALATGFKMGTTGMGGLTGGLSKTGGALMGGGKYSALKGAGLGIGLGAAGMGADWAADKYTDEGSTGNMWAKAGAGALSGAGMGSILGPWGMAIGGLLGGIYGGITAANSDGINDGVFEKPIHDGFSKSDLPNIPKPPQHKNLGADFSKNRSIIDGGKITPIDNKDDILAFKPNGPVDKASKGNNSGNVGVHFDDLKGVIRVEVVSPGNPGLAKELLMDQNFIRDLGSKLKVDTQTIINGGNSATVKG